MKFNDSFDRLKGYCEKENFKGWDPYDGLNSWVIQKTPLGKLRVFRHFLKNNYKINNI